MGLLQHTATLLGSSGQWDSFSSLPHCWEQRVVGPLQYTTSLPSEQWLVGSLPSVD